MKLRLSSLCLELRVTFIYASPDLQEALNQPPLTSSTGKNVESPPPRGRIKNGHGAEERGASSELRRGCWKNLRGRKGCATSCTRSLKSVKYSVRH